MVVKQGRGRIITLPDTQTDQDTWEPESVRVEFLGFQALDTMAAASQAR